MASLKEIYDLAVESNGEDSSVAKAIKRQVKNLKVIVISPTILSKKPKGHVLKFFYLSLNLR
jgi:hypothetical protein